MLTLMTAALVAAQSAPPTDPHAHHPTMQHGQTTAQHEQHKDMKDCCCRECCKGMQGHEGHKPQAQPKRGE